MVLVSLLTSYPITGPGNDRADGVKHALEEVGVHVGKQTQRGRLLELLSRHVIRKTPRISGTSVIPDIPRKKGSKKSKSDIPLKKGSRKIKSLETSLQPLTVVEKNPMAQLDHPDYNRFSDLLLIRMIRDVGIDATGFDRMALINHCKTYSDLSK